MDLMSACIKTGTRFGVVLIRQGSEVRGGATAAPSTEDVGCEAELLHWDLPQAGLMLVRCRGLSRFQIESVQDGPNGLRIAQVSGLADDAAVEVPAELGFARDALKQVIATITTQQGEAAPFLPPLRYDDCAWVANRWCELLPIPAPTKQRMMQLPDGRARLELVAQFLKQRGIAGA